MPEEQPRADSFSTTSPDSAAVPSLYPGPPLLYSCNRHVISLIRLYVVLRGMRAYKARNATSQKRNTHRFWASGFFFFFFNGTSWVQEPSQEPAIFPNWSRAESITRNNISCPSLQFWACTEVDPCLHVHLCTCFGFHQNQIVSKLNFNCSLLLSITCWFHKIIQAVEREETFLTRSGAHELGQFLRKNLIWVNQKKKKNWAHSGAEVIN